MTPDELDDIRKRDAECHDPIGHLLDLCAACADRRTLLKEVDRLDGEVFAANERVALIREAVVELEGVVVNEWLTEDAWVSRDKVLDIIAATAGM